MVEIFSHREIAEQVSNLIRDRKVKARFIRMLHRWQAFLEPNVPLRLLTPDDRDLSLEEMYVLLAAIHDTHPLGAKIDPWPDPMRNKAIRKRHKKIGGGLKYMEFENLKAGVPYQILKIKLVGDECLTLCRLTQILENVTADLSTLQPRTKAEVIDAQEAEEREARGGEDISTVDDISNYVSATDIRKEHTPDGIVLDLRKLKKFLQQHEGIRTMRPLGKNRKPRKNRLMVHLADWYKHSNALAEWYEAESYPNGRATEAEIAARKEAVLQHKIQRK